MSVKNKPLVLKIQDDKVYYSDKHYLPLEETNFPPQSEFKSNKILFWETKITEYDSETKTVYLDILSYDYPYENEFSIYKSNGTLKRIVFNEILLRPLEKHLGSYMPSEYSDYKNLSAPESIESQKEIREKELELQKKTEGEFNTIDLSRYRTFELNEARDLNLYLDITDIEFLDGLIRLKKRMDFYGLGNNLVLEYSNINIKESYSSLLPFIFKILKKNEVEIKLRVKYKNGEIDEILSMKSPDLDLINEKIIHESKITAIKYRFKAHKKENNLYDKGILQIKDLLPEDPELAEDYFLNNELKNHGEELYYLSQLTSEDFSIRFTFSPEFSYIFLIEKERRIHLILETVNINFSTYIWCYNKHELRHLSPYNLFDQVYETTKSELIKLKEIRRQKYKRNNNSNNFVAIEHSNKEGGVLIWKEELEKVII